jgi:hypothetical protein
MGNIGNIVEVAALLTAAFALAVIIGVRSRRVVTVAILTYWICAVVATGLIWGWLPIVNLIFGWLAATALLIVIGLVCSFVDRSQPPAQFQPHSSSE